MDIILWPIYLDYFELFSNHFLTTPTSVQWPSTWQVNGPPESPWHVSRPPVRRPAQRFRSSGSMPFPSNSLQWLLVSIWISVWFLSKIPRGEVSDGMESDVKASDGDLPGQLLAEGWHCSHCLQYGPIQWSSRLDSLFGQIWQLFDLPWTLVEGDKSFEQNHSK